MHNAFQHKQHVIKDGKVRHQCLICWESFGIVSKIMKLEAWLQHVNGHFAKGGFRMCKGSDGIQQRKSVCGDLFCGKLHAGVQ